jgi:hypothetical protein
LTIFVDLLELMSALTNRAHASSYPLPIFFRKAEAGRSESQDVGAPDREVLFAWSEEVKLPEILAARAGQRFSFNFEVCVLLSANSGIK